MDIYKVVISKREEIEVFIIAEDKDEAFDVAEDCLDSFDRDWFGWDPQYDYYSVDLKGDYQEIPKDGPVLNPETGDWVSKSNALDILFELQIEKENEIKVLPGQEKFF